VRVRVTARGLKTINKQGRIQSPEESRRHLTLQGVVKRPRIAMLGLSPRKL
jgi:ribosomal protein L28